MKIDFEHFALLKGIGRSVREVMDVREVFASEMYDHGQGIACHALALKIYNSAGPTEFSSDEYRLMQLFAEQGMTPAFIDSLRALSESASQGV